MAARGLTGATPLLDLGSDHFDIIRDSPVDMMHVLLNVMTRVMGLLKGTRMAEFRRSRYSGKAAPRAEENEPGEDDQPDGEEGREDEDNTENQAPEILRRYARWVVPPGLRAQVDELFLRLALPSNYVTRKKLPFKHTGMIKAHEWVMFVESWGPYILQSALDPATQKNERATLLSLFALLRKLLRREFDTIDIEALREEVSFTPLDVREVWVCVHNPPP
jgi:hypothetical protein